MYESFFGLREPAFSLTPDPRFLWPSETHQEGLAALCYGIARRMGFILLTGGVGSGKTTLLRAALAKIPEGIETAFITNTAGLTDLDLMRLIAAEFRIEGRLESASDCIIALNSFLLDPARAGLRTILIIDEAQNLRVDALEQVRLLSNLEADRASLLQIILTGQPELRRKLCHPNMRQLWQRIAVEHRLEALRAREVLFYLQHRIQVAGGRYEQVFRPEVEFAFYSFSAGCPRLVSLLADRVLLSAYSQGVRPVPRVLVEAKAKEMAEPRRDTLWEADIWDR